MKYNQTYQAIGFILLNDDSVQSYVNCSVSINELESITGEDFFLLLNDDIEEIVEGQVSRKFWGI